MAIISYSGRLEIVKVFIDNLFEDLLAMPLSKKTVPSLAGVQVVGEDAFTVSCSVGWSE